MDKDPERLEKRIKCINESYTERFLQKIIDNTRQFNLMLLDKMARERKISKDRFMEEDDRIFDVLELPMTDNLITNISNGCGGGWSPDKLFYFGEIDRDSLISKYLINHFFGGKFNIQINEEIREEYNPDDSVSVFPDNEFCISGPVAEFEKVLCRERIKLKRLNPEISSCFSTISVL